MPPSPPPVLLGGYGLVALTHFADLDIASLSSDSFNQTFRREFVVAAAAAAQVSAPNIPSPVT
eukprot:892529-Prorocentrum_minimum.AAC.1